MPRVSREGGSDLSDGKTRSDRRRGRIWSWGGGMLLETTDCVSYGIQICKDAWSSATSCARRRWAAGGAFVETSEEVVRLLPAVFVEGRRAGAQSGRDRWTASAAAMGAQRGASAGARPCAICGRRRGVVEHVGADGDGGPDTSITAAERQKIEQRQERRSSAQLARQRRWQIDAFVLGVLGEKKVEERRLAEGHQDRS